MSRLGVFYSQSKSYRMGYNCGGFALGTETWYKFEKYYYHGFNNHTRSKRKRRMAKITFLCVQQMLEDFPGQLRVIHSEKERKCYEEIFFFRVSSDGDFHFVLKHGNAYLHKCGNTPYIYEMDEEEVYSDCWEHRYDGPIVMFAKVKKPLRDRKYQNTSFDYDDEEDWDF